MDNLHLTKLYGRVVKIRMKAGIQDRSDPVPSAPTACAILL